MNALSTVDPLLVPPTPPANADGHLLASRKHTVRFLIIVAVVAVMATLQRIRSTTPQDIDQSRIPLYLVAIGMELLFVRFVYVGLHARGKSLSAVLGRPWTTVRGFLGDLAIGGVGFFVTRYAALLVVKALGGVDSQTAFLIPHSWVEMVLWIAVALSAGVCEEIVFRGYLQPQLAAISGSAVFAVLAQSVVFGLGHGYQGWKSTIVTATYGLILGLMAQWRGVRPGMIAHTLTDIVGGLFGR